MKQQSKFSQNQQNAEEQIAAHESQQQAGQEFSSAEELLRFDARQTSVPPEVKQRLIKSAGELPQKPAGSWWKNLFGK